MNKKRNLLDKCLDDTSNLSKAQVIKRILTVMKDDLCEVYIMCPGDLILFRACDWHAVITVYPKETDYSERFALVQGPDYYTASDSGACSRILDHIGAQSDIDSARIVMINKAMRHFHPKCELWKDGSNKKEQIKSLALELGTINMQMHLNATAKKRKNIKRLNNFKK